jgi:hypothetical protein
MTSIRGKNSREAGGRGDLSFANRNLSAALRTPLYHVVARSGMDSINRDGRAVNSNCSGGTHGI